jgi:hypothetical protein
MTTASDTLGKLTAALVKARADIKHPPRNKVNPHFKNRYADLTAVLDAVVPAFTANGLALVQMVDGAKLVTILSHISGEFISTDADIPAHANAQQLGSALTYLRRYTVQAIAAIAADDDDDGTAASPKRTTKKASASAQKAAQDDLLKDDDSDW